MYLTKRTYIGAEYKDREVVMPELKITIGHRVVNIDPSKVSSIEERRAQHGQRRTPTPACMTSRRSYWMRWYSAMLRGSSGLNF